MKEQPKKSVKIEVKEELKTFEDAAFEMLSTVSPVKLPREDIPFDSVREIVLSEILRSKKQAAAAKRPNGVKNMDELLEEAPSSSSSSSHAPHDGESSSTILERGTMTDDVGATPRTTAARLYGQCTRSSSTSSATGSSFHTDATETKKKPLNYREKRLLEIRQARMKKYRENAEIVEFKCEENCLAETFLKYYGELLDEESTSPASVYFRIVESLDVYFRVKTWESNCPKLLCEFLCDNILKTCQQLNDYHDSKNSPDERRARECQIQVLLTLHVFVVTDDKQYLNETTNKLRLIYIAAGSDRLRNFVEEPVTDIYWELIGDSLATIYDELCISLPADLQQYDNSLFKMTESDDSQMVTKRRNGAANRLEQMLMETSSDFGVGGVERTNGRIPAAVALAMQAPIVRRSLKRRNEEAAAAAAAAVPKELLSPVRPTRAAASSRTDYKHFFVEDTPDEKYTKRVKKEPKTSGYGDEDDDDKTILEEIDEEVKQTPVAKLRQSAAAKSGKRCSKRLSELVKLSEERIQIPRKARENLDKILEKAKTPLRTMPRPTRKSVILGTPNTTPTAKGSSRLSLLSKFDNTKSPTDDVVDDEDPFTSPTSTSEVGESSSSSGIRGSRRRGAMPARYRDAFAAGQEKAKPQVKQEIEDPEFDAIESSSGPQPCSSSSASSSSKPAAKWTDRQLKKQLGLTREDLNRYREAMLTTGEGNRNGKNTKINWENAQVNRAGRVKGAGASEDGTPIFGIPRRNVRTMICHVLLNDTNPDTSFDWNKVKFDDIDNKPRTRSMQSLMQKPEAYMESLKQRYIESKSSPSKKARSTDNTGPSTSSASRRKSTFSLKRTTSSTSTASTSSASNRPSTSSKRSPGQLDEWGLETEADD